MMDVRGEWCLVHITLLAASAQWRRRQWRKRRRGSEEKGLDRAPHSPGRPRPALRARWKYHTQKELGHAAQRPRLRSNSPPPPRWFKWFKGSLDQARKHLSRIFGSQLSFGASVTVSSPLLPLPALPACLCPESGHQPC